MAPELPDSMPIAVYRGPHDLVVEERELPDIGPRDVLVEVSHCGVCGSDLHMVIEGWGTPGSTGGHEWSGVVVAVGDEVREWSVGDQVIGGPGPGCGDCRSCRDGVSQLCLNRGRSGIEPFQGAFAGYKATGADAVYAVPDGLDLRTAALTEPLAVALHGVENGRVQAGQRVLVTGAGPIGLNTIAVLRAVGVDDITVSEPSERRREHARRLGATAVVEPESLVAPDLPMDIVDEPFDVAYECSGHAVAMEAALGQLGRRGILVLVGAGIRRPKFDPMRILMNELVVTGAVEYSPDDFRRAIDLLAGGKLPIDLLVEPDDVPLTGLLSAMEELAAGQLASKVLIVPKQ